MNISDMKHAADGVSVGTVVATLFGWLPEISALLSAVWISIRIWETQTVRDFVARFRK